MATEKTRSKEIGIVAKLYLITYNFLQVLGWCYILFKLISFYSGNEDKNKTLWEAVELSVIIFQNAAALEVVHSLTGLVKSNPVITIFQVLSRVVVVCGVILATPRSYAAASPGLPLALIAWSITEIIRYSFYFSNLIKFVPYFLVWLRYTLFIILYPIGITGELLCFYAATQYAYANKTAWSFVLPNAWNFTFSYLYTLVFIMLLYIPLFPHLYSHMFSQRRKTLGTTEKVSKKVH